MKKPDIIELLNKNNNDLINIISSFSEDELNTAASLGEWSAGEIAGHIIKFTSGFIQLMNGPLKKEKRRPDEKVDMIKNDFLNYKVKMRSPQFVEPDKQEYKKDEVLKSLKKIYKRLVQAADSIELTPDENNESKILAAFELPVYGYMTKLEAICFVIYHTQRHIRQIKVAVNELEENGYGKNKQN